MLMNSAPLLLIRADASQCIGAGHVMRCLAISQAWKRMLGGRVVFYSSVISDRLRERIFEEGCCVECFDGVIGSVQDARVLQDAVVRLGAQAVVIDGYGLGTRFHRQICPTVVLDDNAHLDRYSADFVLNQNAGVTEGLYARKVSTAKLLLGPSYALLRDEFLVNPVGRVSTVRCGWGQRILVTLGGSDPENVTSTVVKGLKLIPSSDCQVRVIVGALSPHLADLVQLIGDDSRFQVVSDVPDMSVEYRWADFAIAAGGSTNWEMCLFGLPRVLVVLADNQWNIAETLEAERVAVNLGRGAEVSPDAVCKVVSQALFDGSFLRESQERAARMVDGEGPRRLVQELLSAIPT